MNFFAYGRWRVRLAGLIFCLLTACTRSLPPAAVAENHSSATAEMASITAVRPHLEILWTYKDAYRLGIEVAIKDYPVPEGYQLACPVTKLDFIGGQQVFSVYSNEDEYFNTLILYNRWYCVQSGEGKSGKDYIFSLVHFWEDAPEPEVDAMTVTLGEVIASEFDPQPDTFLHLPAQGAFSAPVQFEAEGEHPWTWTPSETVTENGIQVTIERVAVQPSFTMLDACVTYDNHHMWRPRASLVVAEKSAISTDGFPYDPPPPADAHTLLGSTHRCYTFALPFDFPLEGEHPLTIGLDQIRIDGSSAGEITEQECEKVKKKLETTYPGMQSRCYQSEIRGEPQHWLQVLTPPPGVSAAEAYTLVNSAFIRDIPGDWRITIP